MTIYNYGSINADHFYRVPHLPKPGETLAANAFSTGLGGKGANQSVAAARAGSKVFHIGAVGRDGHWAIGLMLEYGVETQYIQVVDTPTGHAIVNIDDSGENAIVLYAGANATPTEAVIANGLKDATGDDILMLQNETPLQDTAAKIAKDRGMSVVYSAAPFSIKAVKEVLPYTDILLLNQIEAAQICAALDTDLVKIPVANIIVTKGVNGVDWISTDTGKTIHASAPKVSAIDTTGAGDTFAGYLVAGLDQGQGFQRALQFAAAAAALKVTRAGTADAIPTRADVEAFVKT